MATIRPFHALRYDLKKAGTPESLCSPPYDIINAQEQAELLKKNDYNVIRLELPGGEDRYRSAAVTLKDWLNKGILKTDDKECLYVFEEEFESGGVRRKVNGIVARVKLEEFSKGVVLPHEETLSKAKADRFELMSATFCNFSQIYSLYDDESGKIPAAQQLIMQGKPEVEFTMPDGITHRVWRIEAGKLTDQICAAFEELKLYIADGHHRYETALKFRDSVKEKNIPASQKSEADYMMMALVDMNHPGLVVLPTHRLIKDVTGFEASEVLAAASELFDIERLENASLLPEILPVREKTVAFYCGKGGCFLLKLKNDEDIRQSLPDKSPAYCGLDVTMLHAMILEPILGIGKESMASGKNLTYTRDIDEAMRLVDEGGYQCAFLLNATRVQQIKNVSLAGEKMPQKSTYFYPKLITGLLMNKIMDIPE